jgi:integrase
MATILNRNGRRSIQFVNAAGDRKTLALGKVTQKQAEFIKTKVEALAAACITGFPPDDEVSAWLAKRDTVMLEKLAAVGLIGQRAVATLRSFIDKYTAGRTDAKPATKEIWRQGKMGLIEFFGENTPIGNISPGDADNYKLHLIGKKLASMTVRKRLQFATMIFRAAVRRRLLTESPFADVSIKASMPDRSRFVTVEETTRMLEACPNHHWRTIVALARFGGLRCPSEVLSLRLTDIDWENERITVHSPKTEHHPGKECRTIPLFPELRSILEDAYDAAPEGAVYVVDERMRAGAQGKAGWRNCNLRTTFNKIVKRAELTPWPRLFHNLRSSRQTELAERFPSHVVCAWLGNSEDIARRHYLQVTNEHFRQAAAPSKLLLPALQPALQQPSDMLRKGSQETSGGQATLEEGQNQKAVPGNELRTLATPCAAHVSPCQITRSGWEGIRTPGGLTPTAVFKTAALDHSATHPI